jgi:16S rRNA A1518/A1519 N6-dimethyltransferase RsmA/KsgA/DIM1 with predicted DNA glycosylase/AP lyase activity
MDLEQHFTTGDVLGRLRSLLADLDLSGRRVLEIGAGRGAITELILERGAAHVTAFEIDPGLCTLSHPRLTLREEDARAANLDFDWDCLITVPPYQLLPFLASLVGARDYLLMIPEKASAFELFPGATTELVFDGAAFDPPSRGRHVVIQRGFR